MKLFQEKTQIHTFQEVKEFIDMYSLDEKDFILASQSIYESYFAQYNVPAHVCFKSAYGQGEPTDAMIDALIKDFRESNCERVIAIGGGAVIDMAKLLILDGNASCEQYFLQKVEIKKVRTFIAVPTTCGAGSEVSNISIAHIESMNSKFGLAVDALYPDYAILIPSLLSKLPYSFFATSAIDAFIHAMESYVSPRANVYTRMYSKQAIEMILNGFKVISKEGKEARVNLFEEFLVASNLAGIAFGNAGTGAVHALSYPLSGVYHVTHGEANYQFFSEVFKMYQSLDPHGDLYLLNVFLSTILDCAVEDVYEQIEKLLNTIIEKKPLRNYGMQKEDIIAFSNSVEDSQQRLLNQSYVKFTNTQMQSIYAKLY